MLFILVRSLGITIHSLTVIQLLLDFCSGGNQNNPDETIFAIITAQGYDKDDVLFRAIGYYIQQCINPDDDPFAFIATYGSQIEDADAQVTNLDVSLQQAGLERLEVLCGRNFDEIAGLTDQMALNLMTLQENARDTLELLRCDNLVPIYTSTVYRGTCTYSVQGVTWTFAAFLVIGFMGMFMIMFRSSFLNIQEVDEFKQNAVSGEPIHDDDDVVEEEQVVSKYALKYSRTPEDDGVDEQGDAQTNSDDDYTNYDEDYHHGINKSMASAPSAQAYY